MHKGLMGGTAYYAYGQHMLAALVRGLTSSRNIYTLFFFKSLFDFEVSGVAVPLGVRHNIMAVPTAPVLKNKLLDYIKS